MNHSFLLPTNIYSVTIRQAFLQEEQGHPYLHLCFTINTGDYSYRNIYKKYPTNSIGLDKLEHDMELMGLVIVKDITHPYFTEQFIGLNGKVKVDRFPDGNVVRNCIIEFNISEHKPQYNVLKKRTDEFFYNENNGRKLPIKDGTN